MSSSQPLCVLLFRWEPSPRESVLTLAQASASLPANSVSVIKDVLFPSAMIQAPLLDMSAFLHLSLPQLGNRIAIVRYKARLPVGQAVIVLIEPNHYLRVLQANPIGVLRWIEEHWDILAKIPSDKDTENEKESISHLLDTFPPSFLPFNPSQMLETFKHLMKSKEIFKKIMKTISQGKRILFVDHGNQFDPQLFIRSLLDLFPTTVRINFGSVFPSLYASDLFKSRCFSWFFISLPPEKDLEQFLAQLRRDEVFFDLIWNVNSDRTWPNLNEATMVHGEGEKERWYHPFLFSLIDALVVNKYSKIEKIHQQMINLDQIAVDYEYFVTRPPSEESWRNCFSLISKARRIRLREYEIKFQDLTLKKALQVSVEQGIIALSRLFQEVKEERRKVSLLEQFLGAVNLSDFVNDDERILIVWYRFLATEWKSARKRKEDELARKIMKLIAPTLVKAPLTDLSVLEYVFALLTILHDQGHDVEEIITTQLFSEKVPTKVKIELFVRSLKRRFIDVSDPRETFQILVAQAKNSIALLDVANVFLHLYPREFRTDDIVDPLIKQVIKIEDLALHFDKIAHYSQLVAANFSLKRQYLYDNLVRLIKPMTKEKSLRKEVQAFFNDVVWNPQLVTDERIQTLHDKLSMAYFKYALRRKLSESERMKLQLKYMEAAIRSRDSSIIMKSLQDIQKHDPSSSEIFLERSRKLSSLIRRYRRNGFEVPIMVELKFYHHVLSQLTSKYQKSITRAVIEEWLLDVMEYLDKVIAKISILVTTDDTFDVLFALILSIISRETDILKKKTFLLYLIPVWLQLESNELFFNYLNVLEGVLATPTDWDYFLEWLERSRVFLIDQKKTLDVLSQAPWSDYFESADESVRNRFIKMKKQVVEMLDEDKMEKRMKRLKKMMSKFNKLEHPIFVFYLLWDLINVALTPLDAQELDIDKEKSLEASTPNSSESEYD